MNKFSERLVECLKASGISQAELAKRTNMSKSVVNEYCNGKKTPSLEVLVLICKALGESADYLLGLVD